MARLILSSARQDCPRRSRALLLARGADATAEVRPDDDVLWRMVRSWRQQRRRSRPDRVRAQPNDAGDASRRRIWPRPAKAGTV